MVGDFDGNGVIDYAVSSRLHDPGTTSPACQPCAIANGGDNISGGRGAGSVSVFTSGGLPIRFTGENGKDSVGWAMVGVGDVDGDSEDEFVASAPRWAENALQGPEREEGRLYVIETPPTP